jgi:hypothetical protein
VTVSNDRVQVFIVKALNDATCLGAGGGFIARYNC